MSDATGQALQEILDNLEIGEEVATSYCSFFLRVPGGWVYKFVNHKEDAAAATFIPQQKTETVNKVDFIAEMCHEANRIYCQSIGDNSQLSWENAPTWQKESARLGVQKHLQNPSLSAAASHESWLAEKERTGWVHGPIKDPENKQHPCIVPFHKLPIAQQFKDHLFRTIVHLMNLNKEESSNAN